MKRLYTIIIAIAVVLIILLIYLFAAHKPANAPSQIGSQSQISPAPPEFKGQEDILKNALNLYLSKKQAGVDFSNGPCLGKIADDWVLDIAHNPRLPIDDRDENQCAEYRNGSAHHFIELDPTGNLIRAL